MRKDTAVQLGAAACMLVALAGSVISTTWVAGSIGRNGLVYTDRAEEGDPPEVGIGIAMGAFRGLFVNALWWRANQAKEAGNFYEAVDLSKTITRLQPRFPRVWAFHAWNLAYNISVATQTHTERWQWVNAGIRLLREEGIPANPNDLFIHRELSWILLHKVQGVMDDAHNYYKRMFALEWTIALGPPRRSAISRTREQAINDAAAFLERVSAAPETLDEVRRLETTAAALIDRLKAEAGLDLTRHDDRIELLTGVEYGRAIERVRSALPKVGFSEVDNPVMTILRDRRHDAAFALLIPHVRKRVLIDHYRMEPERMVRYVRQFGPMDWRHPAAHALYWASRGVEVAEGRVTEKNRADFDFLNTDRLTLHAVQEQFRYGTVVFDLLRPEYYMTLPDPDFIPTYRNILTAIGEREAQQMMAQRNADITERPYKLYNAGYENFMRDAISYMYRRGDVGKAQEYKDILYADFKAGRLNWHDQVDQEYQLELPLDEFVLRQIYNRVTTPNVAVGEIQGALQSAFVQGLLYGDTEMFRRQMTYARMFHEVYMKEQYKNTQVDPERSRMEVVPRDFGQAASRILIAVMLQLGVAEGAFEDGAIMYSRAPQDLQLAVYDELSRTLKAPVDEVAAKTGRPKFDTWFPPPEGYAEYRAAKDAQARPDVKKAITEQK
ncbi:MAG: hypothetical protein ACKVS8_01605 [Phycisphaerales bacterium]